MCAPTTVQKTMPPPEAIKTPPPPEKTVDTLFSLKDEEEKTATAKKKRGTQALKVSDVSSLIIP